MLAEPYRLERIEIANGEIHYHLTRKDIPRERLDLWIIARNDTDELLARRVCAALAAYEGTPTRLIGPREDEGP